MGWGNSYDDGDDRVLIFDLRQTYAEIVGAILKQIMIVRQQNNYIMWFNLLDDLHTEINQKLKHDERERYFKKLDEVKKIISENQSAFLGTSKDPNENQKIKNGLKDLEMFLKVLMEKHKMFGAKEEAELI